MGRQVHVQQVQGVLASIIPVPVDWVEFQGTTWPAIVFDMLLHTCRKINLVEWVNLKMSSVESEIKTFAINLTVELYGGGEWLE